MLCINALKLIFECYDAADYRAFYSEQQQTTVWIVSNSRVARWKALSGKVPISTVCLNYSHKSLVSVACFTHLDTLWLTFVSQNLGATLCTTKHIACFAVWLCSLEGAFSIEGLSGKFSIIHNITATEFNQFYNYFYSVLLLGKRWCLDGYHCSLVWLEASAGFLSC